MPKPAEDTVWNAFHRAWTACVGTEYYDKAPWRECAKQVAYVSRPMWHTEPGGDSPQEGKGEDWEQYNREQRAARRAYARGLADGDMCSKQGDAPNEHCHAEAARLYPLRKRVPKVIPDPAGYGEWSVTAGDALFWRHADGGAWFEEGPQLTVARVRALAALLDDPWTVEEDTSVEGGTDG